jgi:hypothetical protein
MNFRSALLATLALQASLSLAHADALFPLTSGRPQEDGNCWAYGASHMLEARAEFRDHLSVMTNIEKSYRYFLLYERLLNSYHRKKADEGDGSGSGVNDIGAFSSDLVEIYQKHGFEILSVTPTSGVSDFDYPNGHEYRNDFQSNPNSGGLHDTDLIVQTEKELMNERLTEDEAIKLIKDRLGKAFKLTEPLEATTTWANSEAIQVTDTYLKLLGADAKAGTHSVILLTTSFKSEGNKRWLRFNSGRSLAINFTDPKDVLTIVRASMDRGWPTTIESKDHVMTALGYKTLGKDEYVYAISDSSGAYNSQGISWVTEKKMSEYFVDSTVYLDAVKDLLPPQDFSKALPPEVKIHRKH